MQWNHGYRYSLDPSLEVKKKKKEIILFSLFQLVALLTGNLIFSCRYVGKFSLAFYFLYVHWGTETVKINI